jgi:uncharacterized protein
LYLFDVNIWVHAHREDSERHADVSDFVLKILRSNEIFGYSPLALSGFLRIVTHPRIFKTPDDFETAMAFTESIVSHPNGRAILPGNSHWHIFNHLCYLEKPHGNLFPDAYFSALAIESGCIWITCDKDYRRYSGLKHIIL